MNYSVLKSVLCFICVLTLLSGCTEQAFNGSLYALDLQRECIKSDVKLDVKLNVRRFLVDTMFARRELVYKHGPLEYKIDHYNKFVIEPGQMITEKTRNWLRQAGIFTQIVEQGSLCTPTHFLEGNITALYGDFQDKDKPAALVEIRIFLIKQDRHTESVLFSKTYKQRVTLQTPDALGLTAGYNTCFLQILRQLENDISSLQNLK